MGKYINQTQNGPLQQKHKAAELNKAGAELLFDTPTTWEEGLICVVDNGIFEAAAYVQDARDLEDFSELVRDTRPRAWLKWDRAKEFAK
jgi:hypothetical protein